MTDQAASVSAASTLWGATLRGVGECGSLTCRDNGGATLDITDADPAALIALHQGRPVRLRSLVRDRTGHAAALRRVRSIRDEARTFAEQHGLAAGWLAIGSADWTDAGGQQVGAPVLLRQLSLVARTASEDDFELTIGSPATLNPALSAALQREYAVTLAAHRVADLGTAGLPAAAEVLERIRRDAVSVPGFTVSDRLVLGTYCTAAGGLADDLEAATGLLAENPTIAVLAGNRAAAPVPAATGLSPRGPDQSGPDTIDPSEEFLILDADAPVSMAIDAVLAGSSLVVEGAPGTGRTQTAANLLASLAAAGRTVLVLVENRQVLHDLRARLAGAGLADLAFDPMADPTAGCSRLAQAVAAAQHPLPAEPDLTDLHRRLRDSRNRLRQYNDDLHVPRQPWGISVYGAQAALLGLPVEAACRVRFSSDALAALHGDTLAEVREAIREWAQLGGTTLTGLDTPWYGARVGSAADAQRAQRLAAELADHTYPAARAALERTLADAGLAPAGSVADWRGALALLRSVAETERVLTAQVWLAPLADLIAATGPAGSRRESADRLGWQERIAARRAARRLWRGEQPVGDELHAALARAAAQLAEWSQRSRRDGTPRPGTDLDAVAKSYAELQDGLADLQVVLPDRDFSRLAPAVLDKTLRGLATDPVLHRLPRLGELVARCTAAGLRLFLLDLHTRRIGADLASTAFEHAWLSSVLAQVATEDPRVGGFDAAALLAARTSFQQADREHLASAASRLRRRLRVASAAAVRANSEQAAAVRAGPEAAGPTGLRQLLAAAPQVVLAAAPCWLMSPYAVPELLPPERLFDVVLLDEANAVSVPVAVAGLARAGQTVLLGDRRQLPPLALPRSAVPPGGSEARPRRTSVLDALAPVLPRVVLPSYRRRTDERLVGFAAATVYGGALLSVPGPDRSDRFGYVPVPHPSGTPGQEESVTAEVQKVVGLVIDHAVRRPGVSFGVVTLGARHAERIAAALRVALVGRPELGDVFRADAAQRFFVKPCDETGGEVRDVIVFSTGLGKDPQGRPSYAFGPLDDPGGERLLTVGLTRARQHVTLVTSLASTDLDPARLRGGGPRLLRALLRYAEVPELRCTPYAEPAPPDGLDLDLRDRLRKAGLPVVTDLGLGARRISVALAAPGDADRLVLALQTDRPSAPGEGTVRDRDRLDPEQLAGLGWAQYRVLATAWFRDPDGEVRRIRDAYQAALSGIATSTEAVATD